MKDFNIDIDPKINPGFTTPENYFENFQEGLMEKLPQKEVKVIALNSKKNKWIYTAAAVLILPIGLVLMKNFYDKSNDSSKSEIENYIANNTSINENDIADLLTEQDVQQMNINLKIEKNTLENELTNNQNLEEILIN